MRHLICTKTLLSLALFTGITAAETPIACNLKALTPAERARQSALSRKLKAATVEKTELASGLSFKLSLAQMPLREVAEWIEDERKCCPFLDFQLSVECDGGAVHLSLTGGPGVKEFLLSDFGKGAAQKSSD